VEIWWNVGGKLVGVAKSINFGGNVVDIWWKVDGKLVERIAWG